MIEFFFQYLFFLHMAIGTQNQTCQLPTVSQSVKPSDWPTYCALMIVIFLKEGENVQQIWMSDLSNLKDCQVAVRRWEPVHEAIEYIFAGKFVLTWLNFDISK